MKKTSINKYKTLNKTILVIGITIMCVTADNALAAGLEDLSRKVVDLIKGHLGQAVIGASVLGGGAVALWAQDMGRACRIVGVGTLIGIFLSAIYDGSFTRFITLG